MVIPELAAAVEQLEKGDSGSVLDFVLEMEAKWSKAIHGNLIFKIIHFIALCQLLLLFPTLLSYTFSMDNESTQCIHAEELNFKAKIEVFNYGISFHS
jgi:hypothetical protein